MGLRKQKEADQAEKPFLAHLQDLRWMLIKSVIALALSMVVTCTYVRLIVSWLHLPLNRAVEPRGLDASDLLISPLGVTDSLNMIIHIGLFSGLILCSPVLFFFIGEFLLPALTPRERRLLIPAFLIGGLLFLSGVFFCYFLVLPQAVIFFIELNEWFGWQTTWTIQNYLDFVLQMLLAFGLSFELPLVIILLAKLGLLTRAFLIEHRRHAILIIIVVAACVTPTSDPYNLALLFFPMYFLYEISILGVWWIER